MSSKTTTITASASSGLASSAGFGPAPTATQSEHAILQAVVHAATEFLQSGELAYSLSSLLAGIGQATGASRAYVFENDAPVGGAGTTATQCAEWTAPGIEPQLGTAAVQSIPLDGDGLEPWFAAFSSGTPFVAIVADLPSGRRDRLIELGVQSIAAVPVFVGVEFWGFIGVDDCLRPHHWTDVEVDALSAAAIVLGAALRRRRMETALREATVQAQLAADIGEVVTGSGDTVQQMLDRCSAAIVKRLQPDLVRIWMMSENHECLVACTAAGAASIQNADSPDMELVSAELTRIAASDHATYWRDGLPYLWPGCEELFEAGGLTAGVGFPLITNGRVTGVVVLLGRDMPPRAMIDALESVTDEIALAIERHQAEGAVVRAELRYRRLVSATVEGIVIHDGTRVVDANPSFAAMLGYTPEEVIGRMPFDFIATEYHEFVAEQLKSNYQQPYEVEGIRKDGTRFPVELKGSDFLDQGRTLRVAAVRDITDRKKVELTSERLRQEQDARALAERTRAQAMFLSDASRILASSMDTSTTLTQLAHLTIPILADYCVVSTINEEVLERVAVVHIDPEKEPLLRAAVDAWPDQWPDDHPVYSQLAAGRSFIASDMDAPTIDDITVTDAHRESLTALAPRSLMAVPIISGGVVLGSILLSLTRADRNYGHDDLALAEEFARRTAVALETARSYHSAQAATRARDEMLAVVAHDLRNPLNTIFMGSELAIEQLGDLVTTPGVRQLQIIRRSAQQMNRLIQDLLDASRIDSGNLLLEKTRLQPAEVMREACDMLSPLAAHERIEFEMVIANDLPAVSADKGRLLQVLSNLVGNALKFTPKGGHVTVGATREGDVASEKCVVTFSVKDTGPGIPPEQLPHIFARGWQARQGDRRGIGLGLAIASGIVEAHGGRIWVDSRLGEGSTFLFTVPAG